jgi:hypothetical protein
MDTVIILKGASNRGKTQTLNLLIRQLEDNHGGKIIYDQGHSSDITNDCFVIIEVPSYGNVGVITYGDYGCEKNVIDALNTCLQYRCKAVIGASHTRVSNSYQTVYSILWTFGHNQNAKTIDTTTYVTYKNWGMHIDRKHLNQICAANLAQLILTI